MKDTMPRTKICEQKNEGISAIPVIILMIAITVIIAGAMYWFVLSISTDEQPPFERLTVEGTVLSVVNAGTYNDTTIYSIKLSNNNTYQMIFRTDNAVVPPPQVILRFYYDIIIYEEATLFDVYMIKSL